MDKISHSTIDVAGTPCIDVDDKTMGDVDKKTQDYGSNILGSKFFSAFNSTPDKVTSTNSSNYGGESSKSSSKSSLSKKLSQSSSSSSAIMSDNGPSVSNSSNLKLSPLSSTSSISASADDAFPESFSSHSDSIKEEDETSETMDDLNSSLMELGAHQPRNQREIDSRSIYVSNIPFTISPFKLKQFFSNGVENQVEGCGENSVKRVTILCDRNTGMPKGYAYIEFVDSDYVNKAVFFDGMLLDGRIITVAKKRTNIPGICKNEQNNLPKRFEDHLTEDRDTIFYDKRNSYQNNSRTNDRYLYDQKPNFTNGKNTEYEYNTRNDTRFNEYKYENKDKRKEFNDNRYEHSNNRYEHSNNRYEHSNNRDEHHNRQNDNKLTSGRHKNSNYIDRYNKHGNHKGEKYSKFDNNSTLNDNRFNKEQNDNRYNKEQKVNRYNKERTVNRYKNNFNDNRKTNNIHDERYSNNYNTNNNKNYNTYNNNFKKHSSYQPHFNSNLNFLRPYKSNSKTFKENQRENSPSFEKKKFHYNNNDPRYFNSNSHDGSPNDYTLHDFAHHNTHSYNNHSNINRKGFNTSKSRPSKLVIDDHHYLTPSSRVGVYNNESNEI